MAPGTIKIIDRLSAAEAIKGLDEEDLVFLNRLIVERLKLIAQARSTTLMANFSTGDRVRFQANDGRFIEGNILRLNKKTISIISQDQQRWNVSPTLLQLLASAANNIHWS